MKMGFYPRLAFDGIRKNKRLVLPFILTCTGMIMMYYIIAFLRDSEAISAMKGGETIGSILGLGTYVIAFFACIFLFYTNSFLMRRRKKEFGLYNILGMGKRNIGRILFWESLLIAAFSLSVGLLCGMAFSKVAELFLISLMQGNVSYTLSVSAQGIRETITAFGFIFILLFLNAFRQVRFGSAISLVRSENAGEKPPKGNWFWGILGVIILGIAYYLAISINNPLSALLVFFAAVLMVILATYLIMIAGSVFFCRILQKKKKYYYKSNHFVSVSSMVYRMKRNGAGLASICILATMVLVMISSTTCLYFGSEGALRSRYPRDINMEFMLEDTSGLSDANIASLQGAIDEELASNHVALQNFYSYRNISIAGMLQGNVVECDPTVLDSFAITSLSDIYEFYFVPLADYNRMMGTHDVLADGEALLYINRGSYEGDTLSFQGGQSFQIVKQIEAFSENGMSAMDIVTSIILVVPDLEKSIEGLSEKADYIGNRMISIKWIYNFDTGLEAEDQIQLSDTLYERFHSTETHRQYGILYAHCESQQAEREDFYSLYGGLFYLGVLLSLVFILAAVLIIYYKQISEGYEDQGRFEIMQKVGMTKQEIRKSINSQLLTVFFLPLVLATLHLAFAFPLIRKLLLLFNLNNVLLFAFTTIISIIAFAIFYTLVYRITSNAYYHIVSGNKEGL